MEISYDDCTFITFVILISVYNLGIILEGILKEYKDRKTRDQEEYTKKQLEFANQKREELYRFNAIRELQRANELIVDGRYGPDTIKIIKDLEVKDNMKADYFDIDEEAKAKEAIENYFTYTVDNDSPEIIKELTSDVIDKCKNTKMVGNIRYNAETDTIQCYMSDDTWIDFNASSIPENEYSDESDKLFEPKSKAYTSDNYNRPLECHHCGAPAKNRECNYCGSILWQ